jgi:hypothetical protein
MAILTLRLAKRLLQRLLSPCDSFFVSFDARERATVRLEGKQQVKCICQQQHAGDSEIEQPSCRIVPSGAK